MLHNARPLERALFARRFEGGSDEAVLQELGRYANADGGFGRALEPDVRMPGSSALATAHGLQVLRELAAPADHPLVRGAVAYLLRTFDARRDVWRVVPPEVNDHPHAPWWHDEAGSLERTFGDFFIIPRVDLLASLWRYAPPVPREWLEGLTERTVAAIEYEPELGSGGGSDLMYVLNLVQTPELPDRFKDHLIPVARAAALRAVSRDPADWSKYTITPLKLAPAPQALVADLLAGDVRRQLDYEIEQQQEDGTWRVPWSWNGRYPDVWPVARIEWQGVVTLETLSALHSYGRIEGQAE